MKLREATTDDAAAIAAVHVSSWQAAYRDVMPADFLAALSIEKRVGLWREALKTRRVRVMLAHVDDVLAGWVAFGECRDADKDSAWGEVEAIYLSPAFWQRGIGKHLMACACELLRRAGYSHASLWVLTENHPAQAFYKKIGFVCDDVVKEFELGGSRLTEIRYSCDLGDDRLRSQEEISRWIENAQASDVPMLIEFIEHVVRTSVLIGEEEISEVLQNVSENLRWATQNADVCVLLTYTIDRRVVGMVLVKHYWNLCCLFVDPDFHGAGIGRTLLSEAVRRSSRTSEHTHMKVNSSLNAVGFYRAMGFTADGSRQPRGSCVPMMLALEK